MMLSNLNKKHISIILIITLLATLAWAVTGCTDFEQWEPPPQQSPEQKTEVAKPPTTKVKTTDRAILAVYEHLLSLAESHEAKEYLADFYTTCDKWSAETELFKDGTSMWHIVLDMMDTEKWEERHYWQQASWLILRDNQVLPSNRFQANALRIEADLQELSLTLESQPAEESGEEVSQK